MAIEHKATPILEDAHFIMEQAAKKGDVGGTMQFTAFQLLYNHIGQQIDPKTNKPIHPQIAKLIANHAEASYYAEKDKEYSNLLKELNLNDDISQQQSHPKIDLWKNSKEDPTVLADIVKRSMSYFLEKNGIEEALADALQRYSAARSAINSFGLGDTIVERYDNFISLTPNKQRELDEAYDRMDRAADFIRSILPAHLQREGISGEHIPEIQKMVFSSVSNGKDITSEWLRKKISQLLEEANALQRE